MEKAAFDTLVAENKEKLQAIREKAHQIHEHVNQHYSEHPYGYHLDMVADSVYEFGHLVLAAPDDLLPLFAGAWFHDSIEDARLTYNDVKKEMAALGMTPQQALLAAEIAYALTNDKGRTRAERAGEKYYQGIRETPYAPFCKMADRVANMTFSSTHNPRMLSVYKGELPHFLESIRPESDDIRLNVPQVMADKVLAL